MIKFIDLVDMERREATALAYLVSFVSATMVPPFGPRMMEFRGAAMSEANREKWQD